MRNYILEAIILMMIVLFVVVEPVSAAITIQDNNEVECSSSYCSSEVKTAERADLNFAMQVSTYMQYGAVRMEEETVVDVLYQ